MTELEEAKKKFINNHCVTCTAYSVEEKLDELLKLGYKEQRKLCFQKAKIDKLTKHGLHIAINANSILNAPEPDSGDKSQESKITPKLLDESEIDNFLFNG